MYLKWSFKVEPTCVHAHNATGMFCLCSYFTCHPVIFFLSDSSFLSPLDSLVCLLALPVCLFARSNPRCFCLLNGHSTLQLYSFFKPCTHQNSVFLFSFTPYLKNHVYVFMSHHPQTSSKKNAHNTRAQHNWTHATPYNKCRSGYLPRIITHPDLHEILLSRIPRSKIVWGKRVIQVDQTSESVRVHFADGTSFPGHVLVGADGTHSGVRTSIYKTLADRNELPKVDKEPVAFNGVCLVGETKPLKAAQFPRLNDQRANVMSVYSEKRPYYVSRQTFILSLCPPIGHFFFGSQILKAYFDLLVIYLRAKHCLFVSFGRLTYY